MTLVGSDSVGDARGWGLAALLKDELSLKVICPVLLKTQGALDDADDMAIRRTVLINLLIGMVANQSMIGFMIYEMMMRCFDYHQQQESEPPCSLEPTASFKIQTVGISEVVARSPTHRTT